MKKITRFFSIFLSAFFGILATQPVLSQEVLIPRSVFFSGERLLNFKMDGTAQNLYFQTDKNPLAIFYISLEEPSKPDSIVFEGGFSSWETASNGIVVIADSLLFHATTKEDLRIIPFSGNISSASILTRSRTKPEEFALSLTFQDEEKNGIYKLDLSRLNLEKLYKPEDGAQLFFDENFNLVAKNDRNDSGGNSIFYRAGEEWKLLAAFPWEVDMFLGGVSKILSVSADGNSIYYTSNLETDKSRLFVFNRITGVSKELAKNEKIDLLPFGYSSNPHGEITSIVGLYAKSVREITDKSVQKDFDFLDEHLGGDISFGGFSDDDSKWLIREFTGGPSRMYLYDRQKQDLRFLLTDYPALNKYEWATRKAFSVSTRDGLELPVHVYLPAGADKNGDCIPEKPLPTVIYVHGGPWVGVAHWNNFFHCRNFQLLANRGYCVINTEFRGASGLGKEFIKKADKTWGSDMTNDKTDIAKWAVKKGFARKEKTAIWGWSYGGYAALAGLAFSPQTYACGIAMYGISDLESFAKTPFADNDFWHNRVGNPHEEKENAMLTRFSPFYHIENIKAPLLLTTGSLDERVPQEQMDKMAEAMDQAGKEVIYFYYPNEVHDYREAGSWISFWAIAEKFLSAHLGGAYEKNPQDLEAGTYTVVKGKEFIEGIN